MERFTSESNKISCPRRASAYSWLVNMQSVLVDTKRDVEGVKRKIDRLLAEDADHRAIVSSRHCALTWLTAAA